jgi:hypothetical protein
MGRGSVSGGDGLICFAFGSAMGDETDNYAAPTAVAQLTVSASFGIASLCWADQNDVVLCGVPRFARLG